MPKNLQLQNPTREIRDLILSYNKALGAHSSFLPPQQHWDPEEIGYEEMEAQINESLGAHSSFLPPQHWDPEEIGDEGMEAQINEALGKLETPDERIEALEEIREKANQIVAKHPNEKDKETLKKALKEIREKANQIVAKHPNEKDANTLKKELIGPLNDMIKDPTLISTNAAIELPKIEEKQQQQTLSSKMAWLAGYTAFSTAAIAALNFTVGPAAIAWASATLSPVVSSISAFASTALGIAATASPLVVASAAVVAFVALAALATCACEYMFSEKADQQLTAEQHRIKDIEIDRGLDGFSLS